jgi:hypothetical protein
MSTSVGADEVGPSRRADVAAQRPLMVHSCSRLGRTANPPGFSLTGWLLPGRRR